MSSVKLVCRYDSDPWCGGSIYSPPQALSMGLVVLSARRTIVKRNAPRVNDIASLRCSPCQKMDEHTYFWCTCPWSSFRILQHERTSVWVLRKAEVQQLPRIRRIYNLAAFVLVCGEVREYDGQKYCVA